MRKRITRIVVVAVLLLTFMGSSCYAATAPMYAKLVLKEEITGAEDKLFPRTMYLKEQSYSYSDTKVGESTMVIPYGKNEAVTVVGKKTVKEKKFIGKIDMWGYTKDANKITFYEVKHYDATCYIPAEVLTSKKPKYSYRVSGIYKKLMLKENAVFSYVPQNNSKTTVYEQTFIYTMGETKNWYKVYFDGKVSFIKKTSKDILKAEPVDTSLCIIDTEVNPLSAEARFKCAYAMLPSLAANIIENRGFTCTVQNRFDDYTDQEHEASVAGYYDGPTEIHVKNNEQIYLETALFHEYGHALFYGFVNRRYMEDLFKNAYEERNNLNLGTYFLQQGEYVAETFEMFVKNPEYLKEKAPYTYEWFAYALKNKFDCNL